jgi:carboxyl-terminal processing protease
MDLLIDLTVKATVVLGAACMIAALQRRASAATRHLTWTCALAGLLILPAATLLLPTWRLPTPGGWTLSGSRSATTTDASPEAATERSDGFAGALAQASAAEVRQRFGELYAAADAPIIASTPASEIVAGPGGAAGLTGAIVVGIWVLGAGLGMILLAVGCWRLRKLRLRSQPLGSAEMLAMSRDLAANLGVKRQVRFLQAPHQQIPMTWGVLRPVVLLPDDVAAWPLDRVRLVLRHEVGHVRRLDCLTQTLSSIARALYWFHPLAWYAAAQQRAEQENACDDMVLASGQTPAADYAEHLLAVTAGTPADCFAAALALGVTRGRRIRRRLAALLDVNRNRRPLTARRVAGVVGIALGALLLVGAAAWSPGAAQAQQAEAPVLSQAPVQQRPGAAQEKELPAEQEPSGAQKSPAAQKPATSTADALKRLQDVHQKLREHYVAPLDDKQLFDAAIKGLLAGLKDPHTDLLPADAFGTLQAQMAGGLTGIGAQLAIKDKRIVVVTPLDNSPALKAGVRPGDFIDVIEGQSAEGLDLNEAVKRIVGKPGTQVRLKVTHADGATEELTLTRAAIQLPTVHGFRRDAEGRWQFVLDPERKIGYAHVLQFNKNTAGELRGALDRLQKEGMKGLILDLRFCPGGLLDQALKVADLFIDDGTILTIRGPGKQEQVFKAKADDRALGKLPLVILVNEQTASAAEIVAGAIRDHKEALLVGSRTFGKGSVQTLLKLDDGAGLKLTTAYHYLPSGRNIQKRPGAKTWGVDPTDGAYVPLTGPQIEALHKNMMERAKLGFKKGEAPKGPDKLTPKAIAEEYQDPQLAAALTAMSAKLTDGVFGRVGQPLQVLHEHMSKLEEMQQKRAALLQSLQELDRNIDEVRRQVGKEKK